MMLSKKHITFIITLVILFSTLSLLISPNNIKAQDPENENILMDLSLLGIDQIDFKNILNQHPYRYSAVWLSNDSYNISGDINFNIYYSTFILNSINFLGYQDILNVTIYKHNPLVSTKAELIAYKEIELNPEFLGEKIQKTSIEIKNVNFSIDKDEYLIFGIEIIQSKKPISSITENKIETRIIPFIKRISNFLKNREDPESYEYALVIDQVLENISTLDIGGEEIASFVNSFVSSAFYYGSDNYDSNVKFILDSKNLTLYFKQESDPDFNILNPGINNILPLVEGFYKIANETKSNTTKAGYWPAINLDTIKNFLENQSEVSIDQYNWAILWALYNIDIPKGEAANTVKLYLKDNNIMSQNKPSGEKKSTKLSKNEAVKFSSPAFERNKIIKNLSAELYIHYPKVLSLGFTKVKATIFDESAEKKEITSETKVIDGATLYEIINRGADIPTNFEFNDFNEDYEIEYNHNLSLELIISNSLSLRPININYNSDIYSSYLKYVYEETDNLALEGISDKDIYAGGSARYEINISAKKDDTVNIDIDDYKKTGSWNVEWYPKTMDIKKDETKTITLHINSTADDISAYEKDIINFYCNITGKTGIDSKQSSVKVKKSAVDFDFEFIYPEEIEIKRGETKSYKVKIRNLNTGYIQDDYTIDIKSKNGVFRDYISSKDYYDQVDIYNPDLENEISLNITFKVPWDTDYESDKITINVYSEQSGKFTGQINKSYVITATITQPNILELIYHYFDVLSNEIGLNDAIGEYGTWLLIALFVILIIIIIRIILMLVIKKYAELICLERIKEISPDQYAEFEIKIKNVTKYKNTYEISTEIDEETKKRWEIELSQNKINILSNQKEKVGLIVRPNDYAKVEDWAKVKVIVKPIDSNKKSEIETMTVLKDSKQKISISGVIHWPKRFKKDDKVETSFKLYNNGDVSADNLTIILLVNGIEKNKIEKVTIPRGGYADIEIPWIAEKGKNEIEIIVI